MPASYNRYESYAFKTVYYDWGPTTGVLNGTFTTYTNDYRKSEYRSFSGSRTPNYRTTRSTNGYLPTLGCSDVITTIEGGEVYQRQFKTVGNPAYGYPLKTVVSVERWISSYQSFTQPPGVSQALVDEAWSKVRRKVLDQDFNAPVFLAEGHKTLSMMTQKATSLYQAIRSFRRLDLPSVARHLGIHPKTVHNTWLEYKYGWMPLLMDIHGGAESLAKLNHRRDIKTFRSSVSQTKPYQSGSGDLVKGILNHTARAWVTVRTRNPNQVALNQLGMLNPLLVAWELVPFSFVGDWFVNVGDCLQELTAFAGVDVLTGGSSATVNFAGSVTEANASPWDVKRYSDITHRRYSRTAGVQTLPRLRIKSNPLNLSKWTTTAALIRQQTSRSGFRYR